MTPRAIAVAPPRDHRAAPRMTRRALRPPGTDALLDWDARADRYDDEMRGGLPGYDALHDVVTGALVARLRPGARLLVVGCGTGEELVRLARHDASWQLTGVDPSAPMLARADARCRAAGVRERVTLVEGRVDALPAAAVHDAATLVLVMHFLHDDGAAATLLGAIAARLAPGAPLLLAEMHGDPRAAATRAQWAAWRGALLARGAPPERADAGLAAARAAVRWRGERRIRTLLHDAGFARVVPLYRALLVGAWFATRVTGTSPSRTRSPRP
jgi:tRNA (cmo5U34)-methyltransferase